MSGRCITEWACKIASDEAGCPITKRETISVQAVLAAALTTGCLERCLMEPINERFAPAEGYTTHEALKAIFRQL